jgi:riboflavin transporter FmnP
MEKRKMNKFKCIVAGCATSVLSGVAFMLISFAFSLRSEGSKGNFSEFSDISVEFTAGPLLLVVLLAGFAIGFFWMLKRSSGSRLST